MTATRHFAHTGRLRVFSAPQPWRSQTSAKPTAAVGNRTRSTSVSTTTTPRLLGQRHARRLQTSLICKLKLRVCPGTSCGIAEPSQHEADRGKAEEGERLAGEVLPILGQSTAAVQPSYARLEQWVADFGVFSRVSA